jgi:hypothetical protein
LGTVAPVASVTTPVRLAVDWPMVEVASTQTRISKKKTHVFRNEALVATAFIMLFLLEAKKSLRWGKDFLSAVSVVYWRN